MNNLIMKSSWFGTITRPIIYDRNVYVFIDEIPEIKDPNSLIIIVLQEPFTINNILQTIYNNKINYDYLFTYDENTLNNNSKAIEFMGTNTRIIDFKFEKKIFGVSTLVGGKNFYNLEGYRLRHSLWSAKDLIEIPKSFYLSSETRYHGADYNNSLVLGSSKNPMFNCQYHITIENTSMKNMFTEKIIDCFQTKTIPIYYGATNIGDYFDDRGIIQVRDLNDIISVVNSLNEGVYKDKEEYVEYNYHKSMKYCNYDNLLIDKIEEIIYGRK